MFKPKRKKNGKSKFIQTLKIINDVTRNKKWSRKKYLQHIHKELMSRIYKEFLKQTWKKMQYEGRDFYLFCSLLYPQHLAHSSQSINNLLMNMNSELQEKEHKLPIYA